jgi:hypothetical protein
LAPRGKLARAEPDAASRLRGHEAEAGSDGSDSPAIGRGIPGDRDDACGCVGEDAPGDRGEDVGGSGMPSPGDRDGEPAVLGRSVRGQLRLIEPAKGNRPPERELRRAIDVGRDEG